MLDGEYDRQLVNNKWNVDTEVDARMMDDEGRQATAAPPPPLRADPREVRLTRSARSNPTAINNVPPLLVSTHSMLQFTLLQKHGK